ncbi:MAG: hypothetical protein OEM26_17960 [Saprospiraceae bacterium]|nr:hypothetical protein [Saprospiraceae bacterium]
MQEDSPNQPVYYQDDEITLKELILKLQEYFNELLRNWKLIALICVPFVAYKLYQAFKEPTVYPAELTFMVDEDEGGSYNALGGILGQFGFSANQGYYNLDKILEISKSRRVLQMGLAAEIELEDKQDFFANHIIRAFDMHQRWRKDTTGLSDFRFQHMDYDRFSKLENRALKAMINLMNGTKKQEASYQTSYNETTGIMKLEFDSPQESLSIHFLDTIFHRLRGYYIEKAIEKAEATYNVIKDKTDSLQNALAAAEYQLANFTDQSRGIYSARDGALQQTRLSNSVQRLQVMYAEALKNLEIAEFSLKRKEPFFALIDSPIPPIKPVSKSKLKAVIIGALLGSLISVMFVVGRKIYREAMQSP